MAVIRRLQGGPLGLCVLGTLLGCVTTGQGEKMQAETAKLRDRIEAIENRSVEANEQMLRLRQVLDEATKLLTRNSANVGARVDKNENDLAVLAGKIEEARHIAEQVQKKAGEDGARYETRIAALEQGQQKIVDRVAPSIPEDKDSLWKEAQSRVAGGMRDDARRFLRAFVQRFPDDARAPEALLQMGRLFAAEGKHPQATAEFQKVLDAYQKSPEVPEAMWLLGQSFIELKFCSDARVLLMDLTKRYPRSSRVGDAKQRVRELQKIARDKKLCTS